jgi:hypothetical protein
MTTALLFVLVVLVVFVLDELIQIAAILKDLRNKK